MAVAILDAFPRTRRGDLELIGLLMAPCLALALTVGFGNGLRKGPRSHSPPPLYTQSALEPDKPKDTAAQEISGPPADTLPPLARASVAHPRQSESTVATAEAEPALVKTLPSEPKIESAPGDPHPHITISSLDELPPREALRLEPDSPGQRSALAEDDTRSQAGVCFPRDHTPAMQVEGAEPPHPFGRQLAAAALAQTQDLTIYTAKYRRLSYPMGDLPMFYGACSDVVVRAYRAMGIDLQEVVQGARLGRGDPSIDHRRTEVLRVLFARLGQSFPVSAFPEDYAPGDVVTYERPFSRVSRSHIAIVADVLAPSGRPMIVHNRGWGAQLEDALFADRITGHYRFAGTPVAGMVSTIASARSGGGRSPHGASLFSPVSNSLLLAGQKNASGSALLPVEASVRSTKLKLEGREEALRSIQRTP